jgi:hypothetical protein
MVWHGRVLPRKRHGWCCSVSSTDWKQWIPWTLGQTTRHGLAGSLYRELGVQWKRRHAQNREDEGRLRWLFNYTKFAFSFQAIVFASQKKRVGSKQGFCFGTPPLSKLKHVNGSDLFIPLRN